MSCSLEASVGTAATKVKAVNSNKNEALLLIVFPAGQIKLTCIFGHSQTVQDCLGCCPETVCVL